MRILLIILLVSTWALAESNFPYLGTDTNKTRIPLEQILSAGPPPQGIPALGFSSDRFAQIASTAQPKFVAVANATFLTAEEPVVVVGNKAYPLQILRWHEIINDGPASITYSPLCNSAVVYDRRIALTDAEREAVLRINSKANLSAIDAALRASYTAQTGQQAPAWALEVSFGTSGMLYNANPLIFDSATGSVFSQLTGEGSVGILSSTRLLRIPAQVVSFSAFAKAFPSGQVLSTETGFTRAYAQNPYIGYEQSNEPPLVYQSSLDSRLKPKERVVTVELGSQSVAYPLTTLAQRQTINDQLAETEIVLWWSAGTRSALDTNTFDRAKDVGAVGVFVRKLDGRVLNFRWNNGSWIDQETSSRWNILGQATDGPLKGKQLAAIPHDTPLWFAWAAFKPNTQLRP